MVVLCPRSALRAADSVPFSNAITASLEYQEAAKAVANWGVSVTTQTTPFKKEPAVPGKIVRGVLNFGGAASNSIPFLWQRDAGKLCLDLNRNEDLTDDPAGEFSTRAMAPVYFEAFTGVHVVFNTSSGRCQALVDLSFYDYGPQPSCFCALRSFWHGKVTLQGCDWQVGVVQIGLNQSESFEKGRLLLIPWDKRNLTFNADDGSLACVRVSRKLFLDGQAYQVDVITRADNGEAKLALQFTEQTVPLGELDFTGQFIHRLELPGGIYRVILDRPAGIVKVPVGTYAPPNVQLEKNGVTACCTSSEWQGRRQISVDGRTPTVLNAGGPLTNSVAVGRHGRELRLDYRLVGGGGEIYRLANQNPTKPPGFVISKDGKQLASGAFEFG
jgi:hypothetical protein